MRARYYENFPHLRVVRRGRYFRAQKYFGAIADVREAGWQDIGTPKDTPEEAMAVCSNQTQAA